MFENNQPRNILRVPKVFQAPRDEQDSIWPRIIKLSLIPILVIGGLIYLFFFSTVFQVKNIEIVGSPSDEVKQKLETLKSKNIFSFHAKPLEDEIISHNQNYLSVKVYRGLPDTVKVKFQDREPKIIWTTQNVNYFVDKNAILFQIAADTSGLPVVIDTNNLTVTTPEQIATSKFVDFVKSASDRLSEANVIVKEFQIKETTFQIEAITDTNIRIIFDTMRPLSEQIDAFRAVYEKNKEQIKEYLDLRVEGWVYFK